MSESQRHHHLCELLYRVLRHAAGPRASVAAELFVYYQRGAPSKRCAPDAVLELDAPPEGLFTSWRTWEHGVPDLCVEILSPSDTEEKLTLPQKLHRFEEMGVREVVAFDVDRPRGSRVLAWDRVGRRLAPRAVTRDRTRCKTLGAWFVVVPCPELQLEHALRLARDAGGRDLLLTREEAALAETSAALADKDAEIRRLHEALAKASKSARGAKR